jgi:fibronectin-binding autotransporter adhesin
MKAKSFIFMVFSMAVAVVTVQAQTTYTWANSNVSGTPVSPLDWFTGGPNAQGTWAGGDPISNNGNTIQLFEDTTTALPNTATPSSQTVNLNNGGNAFQLGALTLSGRGSATTSANLTMTLSGDALHFSASNGTINLNAVNNTQTITINVTNAIQLGTSGTACALTITGAGSSTFNLGGAISELQVGGGSLIKNGNSTVTLSGANSFTGGIVINAGTINISANNNLGSTTAPITVTGNSGITSTSVSDVEYTRAISLGSGTTLTLNNNVSGTTASFSGPITGSGHVTVGAGIGSNTINLSSTNNTFTGDLTLAANPNSTLARCSFVSIGDAGAISIGKSGYMRHVRYTGASNLVLNNRRIDLNSSFANVGDGMGNPINMFESNGTGSIIFNAGMTVAAGKTGTFFFGGTNTGDNTYAGIIPNSTGGTLSISTYGTAKWIFTNDNTYAGNAIAAGGILSVTKIANAGVAQPLGIGSIIQFGYRGGSGNLEFTGASNNTTDKQVQIGETGTNQTGTGGIINNGTGALTFSAATFNIALPGTTVNRTFTLGGSNTGDNTISGIIQNNATNGLVNLTKTGIGKWTISGANTFTGPTTLSGGGTLVLDYTTADNSKLSDTGALSVSISGNSGGGKLILSGGNHTEIVGPTTTLNNGTGLWITRTSGNSKLQLNTISRPNGQAAITFSEDSIATTDNTNVNGILGCWATVGSNWAVNSLNGAGGAIIGLTTYETTFPTSTGDATKNYQLTGSQTQTGTTTGNSLRLVNGGNSDVLALGTSSLTPGTGHNAGILYVGGFDNNYTITGSSPGAIKSATANNTLAINVFTGTLTVNALLNSGSANTLKYGVGTLVIGGNNTASGALYILEGAARLTHNNAAGTTAGGITVQNGAALELANSVTIGNEALTLVGTGISDGGALCNIAGNTSTYGGVITIGDGGARINSESGGSLTLANGIVAAQFRDVTFGGSGNTTVAGLISGAGNLFKDGSGTLTLTGTNTYSGKTVVNGGKLALGGHNVLNGKVVTLDNGTLDAGAYTNTFSTLKVSGSAAIELSPGAVLAFADSSAITWDGTLNISGAFVAGTSLRFGTSSAGLTPAQIGFLTVTGYKLSLDDNGYLTGRPSGMMILFK